LDWYKKLTKDWLVVAPILATAGANPPFINGGNVTNQGVELMLSYSGQAGDLRYTIGGNGAYNRNTVTDIPTQDGIIHGGTGVLFDNSGEFNRVQTGYPIGYFWGWKTDGIFQTEEEVNSYRSAEGKLIQPTAKPGDVRYADINGDGVINESDKTMLGNPNPKYTFGFNLQLNYKGFDFSVLASGVVGNHIVQSYRNHARAFPNYTRAMLNRWHGEGTSNFLPRVNESNSNWVDFSDLYIQKGDFLRISNVTLGYDFAKMLKMKNVNQVRLYTSALNLFTFTKYNGMDPEIGYGYNSWSTGIDVGYYPRPRTYLVGLNVKF
jgi:TonB-dependent starch-binding outer membrane protein SusC